MMDRSSVRSLLEILLSQSNYGSKKVTAFTKLSKRRFDWSVSFGSKLLSSDFIWHKMISNRDQKVDLITCSLIEIMFSIRDHDLY